MAEFDEAIPLFTKALAVDPGLASALQEKQTAEDTQRKVVQVEQLMVEEEFGARDRDHHAHRPLGLPELPEARHGAQWLATASS